MARRAGFHDAVFGRRSADDTALAETRRVNAARFWVVKEVGGRERIMGHAREREPAERQALAVGGRVVER